MTDNNKPIKNDKIDFSNLIEFLIDVNERIKRIDNSQIEIMIINEVQITLNTVLEQLNKLNIIKNMELKSKGCSIIQVDSKKNPNDWISI